MSANLPKHVARSAGRSPPIIRSDPTDFSSPTPQRETIELHWAPKGAQLGLTLKNAHRERQIMVTAVANIGVLVAHVTFNGEAYKASLREGDHVLRCNDQPLRDKYTAQKVITSTLKRDHKCSLLVEREAKVDGRRESRETRARSVSARTPRKRQKELSLRPYTPAGDQVPLPPDVISIARRERARRLSSVSDDAARHTPTKSLLRRPVDVDEVTDGESEEEEEEGSSEEEEEREEEDEEKIKPSKSAAAPSVSFPSLEEEMHIVVPIQQDTPEGKRLKQARRRSNNVHVRQKLAERKL